MWRDQPARTLMAHLGKDSYSHIHYDSDQARTISVREAARLQSFPDGFMFCGTMNPAFRQIGNSVPPLMAKAIAAQIMKTNVQEQETEADEPRHRQQQFLGAAQAHFGTTKTTRSNKLFGVSNSAKIVEGGLQLGVANLESAREDAEAFTFACV